MQQKKTGPGIPKTLSKREMVRIIAQLFVAYSAAGAVLASVNAVTAPRIERNHAAAAAAAASREALLTRFKKLMPQADDFAKMGTWTIHDQAKDYYQVFKAGNRIGYVIFSCGKGFSSMIQVAVAIDPGFTVQNIAVLSQAETPAMGGQVAEDHFLRQFVRRPLKKLAVSNGSDSALVQAVTGATISSKAVTEDAVKSAVLFLKGKMAAQ